MKKMFLTLALAFAATTFGLSESGAATSSIASSVKAEKKVMNDPPQEGDTISFPFGSNGRIMVLVFEDGQWIVVFVG
jgi:hypothetical protein